MRFRSTRLRRFQFEATWRIYSYLNRRSNYTLPGIDRRLKRIYALYHFTDRRNLPLIREHGGLYPLAKLRKKNIEVPAPGGNQWSHDADEIKGMDEYVHLCFCNNHPMEHVARQAGHIGQSSCRFIPMLCSGAASNLLRAYRTNRELNFTPSRKR